MRGLRAASTIVVAVVATIWALGWTSSTTAPVSIGNVNLSIRPGTSETAIVLPPLGRISGDSHRAPFQVRVEVRSLDLEQVQELARAADPAEQLREEAGVALEKQARRLLVRTLLLSVLVGAAAAALLPGRRWRFVALGALVGILTAAAALGSAWRGYDATVLERNPRFEGALERAPALLETVQRHVDDVDLVRNRVAVLGGRIAELYTAAAFEPTRSSDTRILHVSDIHLNPLGIEVVHQLVENFAVDAVLDTGDLTSFGSPLEARIAELVDEIPVPYYLVPGNHDSPANRQAFDAHPAIEVLDGETADIAGVRILGVADPTFTASGDTDTDEANEEKRAATRAVGRLVRRTDPDVLALHDHRMARDAIGDVSVIVAGHTHERAWRTSDGTISLTVGSTGATGLGSFTASADLSYEAQVLTFRRGRLVAVDYVSLPGFGGSFTVEHTVVEDQARGTEGAGT